MIVTATSNGNIIRKASKATAILQLFSVVLLGLLAYVYSDISSRYSMLHDGIRENAMWSVYQLDREAHGLLQVLDVMLAKDDRGRNSLKALSLRYDIMYSRMSMLGKARFEQHFAVDEKVRKQLTDIQRAVYNNSPLFDSIASGAEVSLESLKVLQFEITVLARNTDDLLIYTNNTLSANRADARAAVEALERKSAALIGLLVLCVAFLIFTLRRQLTSVRAAGISLETMAAQLNTAYEAAEAGNRAKSQFMATMGHEIRTPLNAILGMVELLELTTLSDDTAARIRTIRRSGEALLDIINEILDFAKIEHGKLELENRVTDLQTLAENSAEMMRGRATESGIAIRVEMPRHWLSRCVVSDPTRLRQVILNLMSNAVKFTPDGTVTLRMTQLAIGGDLWLRTEVQDTGIGIDDAGKEKLFRPFSQVDASISRKYGGTGLGLTICKEIIDRFGGRIGVESAAAKGSLFWFEIPVFEAAETEEVEGATGGLAAADLRILEILVVEDNKVNQQVISRFLSHLGQAVTLADNGAVAVKLAFQREFDLILMDMQMPVMDGIEATQRIRSSIGPSASVPIVAMTANASEADRKLCLEAGMTGFQSKPISLKVLHDLILATGQTDAPAISSSIGLADFDNRRREIVDVLGDEAFGALLNSFFDDTTDLLKALHGTLASGNHDDLDRLLHTLKGAALNLGLTGIAEVAQKMRKSEPEMADIELLSQEISALQNDLAA